MHCPHCKKELTSEQVASLLGSITSKDKKISSAENGKLGGRPKKVKKEGKGNECIICRKN